MINIELMELEMELMESEIFGTDVLKKPPWYSLVDRINWNDTNFAVVNKQSRLITLRFNQLKKFLDSKRL